MSALPAFKFIPVPAFEVFEARCQARAHLCIEGEMDFHEAVDGLQAYAVESGLVEDLGQDTVQRMLGDAFAKVPRMAAASSIIRELIEFFETLRGNDEN